MYFEEKIGKKFFAVKKEKSEKTDKKQLIDRFNISPNTLIINDNNFQEKLRAIDEIKNFQNLTMDHHSDYLLNEQLPSYNEVESNLFSKKGKIIIKSLISFNKDNTIPNIKNFEKRELNYSKNNNESNIQIEIYTNINLIILKTFNNSMNESDYNKLNELKEKFTNLEILVFKSLITSIMNLILDWAINIANLNSFFENDNNNNSIDSEIFIIIYNKYNEMKNICENIEKDFNLIFDKIKKEVDIHFTLIELFTDLFWDFIFRIHQINCKFSPIFFNENLDKKLKSIIEEIINILFSMKIPLKKKIGELLNISWILEEKIYLSSYIINLKSKLFDFHNLNSSYNFEIKPKIGLPLPSPIPIISLKETYNGIRPPEPIKQENKEEKEKKIYEKLFNENDKNKDIKDINYKSEDDKKENENINKNNNNIKNNNIDKISTKDEEIQTNINENNDENNNNNNGKKISIDELLVSIMNVHESDNNNNNKSKKKNKKKKKKKNNSIIIQNEEILSDNDPIVDKFKSELNSFNTNSDQKIRPKLSTGWLNSITLKY